MMRIVQTGTFCSSNKGDAAMQIVHARELELAMPGAECVIGTPRPGIDRGFYAPTRCVRSSRRNLALGSLWLLLLWTLRIVGVQPQRFRLDAEIDAMAEADAVVDLSGDMLTEEYGVHVGYSHFLPLLQALALGKPLFVIAQSVGPFRLLTPLARFALRRAALVTVREHISHEALLELGIPAERLRLTADLAFLLPRAKESRVDAILASAGHTLSKRRLLGVSISALLINQRHGSLQKSPGDPLGAVANALDRVSERHDLDLILISHVTGPLATGDDRRIARKLRDRLKRSAMVVEEDLRPAELKGVIARCHAFFGFRMHANIAALDTAVPVLAVSYSHKTSGIMSMFGMEGQVVPFSEVTGDNLEGRLEDLLRDHQGIRARLEQLAPQVRAAARENIRLIAAHLETIRQSRPGGSPP